VYRQGDYGQAAALFEESLALSRDIGAKDLVAKGLEYLAWVAAAQRRPQRAARLAGSAEGLREALAVSLWPEQRAGHDQMLQAVHTDPDAEACTAAWTEGRALPLEEAIALALEGAPAP
jgi:non-specific serine/threonine protein kinase